jgi:tellurite resistance protein TehA-like permease
MATGIVSVGLGIDGDRAASDVFLGLAVTVWLVLAALFARRLLYDRARFRAEARSAGSLAAVAGTAVLGSRFVDLGSAGLGLASLVVAALLWVSFVGRVLRALPDRGDGLAFLLTVSTQSLAVLSARLAVSYGAPFLEYLSLPLVAAALGLYALVLTRLDPTLLRVGRGDQWICGGALAITTLALAQVTTSASLLDVLGGGGAPLRDLTLASWVAAAMWLPAVVVGELWRPRLGYSSRRWATVFPLGMYAVSSQVAGTATGHGWLVDFGRAWIWIAVAAWLLTAFGLARQARRFWPG